MTSFDTQVVRVLDLTGYGLAPGATLGTALDAAILHVADGDEDLAERLSNAALAWLLTARMDLEKEGTGAYALGTLIRRAKGDLERERRGQVASPICGGTVYS